MTRTRRTKAQLAEIDAAILHTAEEEKPISIRGLFYRVMSTGLVPKTEKGYRIVQRQSLKLRRSGELPYGWITDGSRLRLQADSYNSAQEALEHTARFYRQNLWHETGIHVEVWAEKDAIRGVVHPVTNEFDVPLMIARGFSSETFLHQTAEDINCSDAKTAVIYHLGDHDPSGVTAWNHIQSGLRQFTDTNVDLEFHRLAVTTEQIEELSLPTRPTKATTHGRGFEGDSVEVDAIPSTALRRLVREAIEQWIDPHQMDIVRQVEESERSILMNLHRGLAS